MTIDDTASITSTDDAVATAAQDRQLRGLPRGWAWRKIELVPCGHQRFCESRTNEVFRQGRRCPICRAGINMILRLH